MSVQDRYTGLLDSSYTELEKLKKEVTQLEGIRRSIEELKSSNDKLPVLFEEKFFKIKVLSEDYTKTLGLSTKIYLDGTNTLFTDNLKELSDRSKNLQKEISRLTDTDFITLFQNLQGIFIAQTREDLAVELVKLDQKSLDFQNKINGLQGEVVRLEAIDLDKHFDKLQRTLSDIFGAVNAINLTLANLIQTLTGIVQNIGTLQNSIESNQKETKQLLNVLGKATEKHLSEQDNNAKIIADKNEDALYLIKQQNLQNIKYLKTTRQITIIGFVIVIGILCFLVYKHKG